MSCLVFCVLCFCVFSSWLCLLAPNECTTRFMCGGESYTLFVYVFVKNFHFLYRFLCFGVAYAFLIGFLFLFAELLVCM